MAFFGNLVINGDFYYLVNCVVHMNHTKFPQKRLPGINIRFPGRANIKEAEIFAEEFERFLLRGEFVRVCGLVEHSLDRVDVIRLVLHRLHELTENLEVVPRTQR